MFLFAATVAALLAGGCRDEGVVHDCGCTFLTDFDDASKEDVTVCAPTAARAAALAKGCAQTAAPGPVQACACQPTAPRVQCTVGLCDVHRRE